MSRVLAKEDGWMAPSLYALQIFACSHIMAITLLGLNCSFASPSPLLDFNVLEGGEYVELIAISPNVECLLLDG